MTQSEIAKIRLANQHVLSHENLTVKEVADLMGAMQAQDYSMARWAFGIRMRAAREKDIADAEEKVEIIRTHLLRPTWHFVSAENIRLLLGLSASRIKASMAARLKELELGNAVLEKSLRIISELLAGTFMTRDKIMAALENGGISTGNGRGYHLLSWAELSMLVCSGPPANGKVTYALLDERVPAGPPPSREEALEWLAVKYFTSHGPATLRDFIWWSGLAAGEARLAIKLAEKKLEEVVSGDQKYWLAPGFRVPETGGRAFLLPAFDEFIISYNDRSASLALTHNRKAVSDNGIFRPVIIIDGQVAGLWKRSVKNENVIIEAELFGNRSAVKAVKAAADEYARFLGKKPQVIFNRIYKPIKT